jgi:hypothetical protein
LIRLFLKIEFFINSIIRKKFYGFD